MKGGNARALVKSRQHPELKSFDAGGRAWGAGIS
jgi:hypothetical protein